MCDSILKAQAQPSPMSMMPAFSPGPWTTRRTVALASVGRRLQVHARGFVGAVLAPHHAVNAEFGEGWGAAQRRHDARVLLGREAVLLQ